MAIIFTGCKKDEAQHKPAAPTTKNLKAAARAFESESDVEAIVKDAEEFQKYADDLRANNTPNAGDLPTSFSPEDAVFLLESTTNYWYGRPDHFRPNDTTAGYTQTLKLENDGNIKLEDLAANYNAFRDDFKTLYEGIGGEEKSFGFTDVEYDAEKGELRAAPTVHTGAQSTSLLALRNIHYDITFTGNTFYEGGDVNSSPSCPNVPRSMPVLSYYVRQNLGFYDGAARSIYDPIPVAINIVPYGIFRSSPEAYTSNSNPWSATNSNVLNHNRLFALLVSNNGNYDMCIPTNAMNFYRSEQKQMVINRQNILGKKCIKYLLGGQIPGTIGPAYYEHYASDNYGNSQFQFANIIYVPSPNVATF